MPVLEITTIGSSAGILLTEEVMARLGVKKGSKLYLTDAPGGAFRLTPYDSDVGRQLGLAEQVMQEDRDMLSKLAKR